MATLPSYIPLRDDAGIKAISKNERDFIRKCALHIDDANETDGSNHRPLRLDGRRPRQSRPTRLVLVRYPHNGASAATLQWGTGTRVTVSCTGDVIPPNDRPNEGMVHIGVELSPTASTAFRQVAPASNVGGSSGGNRGAGTADEAQKLETNRILRALERLLSSCLDTEALVVTQGQWVWRLSLNVVVLDAAAGNLLDACWMATLAALQHYRQPHAEARTSSSGSNDENDNNQHSPLAAPVLLSLDAKEGTPLPLHQTPFAVSFALIAPDESDLSSKQIGGGDDGGASRRHARQVVFLQDPSNEEEIVAEGRITYALNVHQEVCLVDFGGGAEIKPSFLRQVHEAAVQQVAILSKALTETLAQADEQAVQQRLKSLKQQSDNTNLPATAADMQQDDDDDNAIDLPPLPQGEIKSPDDLKAEEEYRKQALDYNLGHVAQPLADDRDVKKKSSSSNKGAASALLASLLQTASQSAPNPDDAGAGEKQDVEMMVSKQKKKPREPMDEVEQEEEEPRKLSKAKAELAKLANMSDDDEEETTMQLQSEFSRNSAAAEASPTPKAAVPLVAANDDDDVDDLAAAIKTKKKKKKKK